LGDYFELIKMLMCSGVTPIVEMIGAYNLEGERLGLFDWYNCTMMGKFEEGFKENVRKGSKIWVEVKEK
jgi:hypothetical protein